MTPLVEDMAKKKEAPKPPAKGARPKGRPKRGGRLSGRYVVVHSPEHRLWMDEYLEFLGEPEFADVIREAIVEHAKARGFREPPKL
jgi:hypothetical protein